MTKVVIVRPWRASWWVKSIIGNMWPCAGYGILKYAFAQGAGHGFCVALIDLLGKRMRGHCNLYINI